MTVRLGTGPVSWGVDFADHPANPPWQLVLDEIAQAGYRCTELGPVGYLPEDPMELRAAVATRGLAVGGSFLFQPLHDGDRHAEVLAVARRTCSAIAVAGGRHLVVIDLVSPERAATAGRSAAARRLSASEWDALVEGVYAVASLACSEYGLEPVFHPHVGSYVEFEDEIERLLAALADDIIGLCVDTGHCAYAAVDPVALLRRHADRTPYLHLKDVDPTVRRRAVDAGWDFWRAIGAGVFCPVGTGCVDFKALAIELVGRDCWATVEQDRDPKRTGHPLADAIASRQFLEGIGIGDHDARRVGAR